ncbi:MAG: DUF4214 domain-containing protein [Cellulomonadaceae bacterium]|nr:DUF4214 domain-containing protein [Cellulomonadaceae bacterium]
MREAAARVGWMVCALSLVMAGMLAEGAAPAAAATDGTVTITGHGWGHGRGMGQYGAYGYAKAGWGYQAILAHYYGGTALAGDAGNPTISVELQRLTGKGTIVTGTGLAVDGVPVAAGVAAVLITRTGAGTLQVSTAPGCGGPWTALGAPRASGTTVTDATGAPTVCETNQGSRYRGAIRVLDVGGTQYTLNIVPIESYLRGVVPRESPASWGNTGGIEALKAQSVAARSYVLGSGARPGSGATTCDSTSCQVYGGVSVQPYGSGVTQLENAITDTVIQQTAGQVMRFTSTGKVARTEFSSSTGGWTAGGTFPAVEDAGDSISPYHTWTVSTTLPAVATALGTGAIRTISVTARNGLGADGGRVLTVTVVETGGAVRTFSGSAVRIALGLRSDWFSISAISVTAARAVVQALYQDVLGRGTDPAGLEYWTAVVTATGDPSRVTAPIVASRERLETLVRGVYQDALHRAPDAAGLNYWVGYLAATQRVADLQVAIFSSPESLQVLGGGDTGTWVGGMYQALLKRTAAPAEAQYWAGVAQSGGRAAAVGWIARSPEAGTRRLDGYYQTFLGRSVDPSGVASWLPLMAGTGDFTVPGILGSSPEYWARAQTRFP